MKQVLIISASPRKGGNSDSLCDAFRQGAQQAGHQVEKIFLREHTVNYCTGCGVCNNTHRCTQKDDMESILSKLVAADVIVLASPIYFYTMCGQLKTMIDRCCPRYTELKNKSFYYLLSAADPMPSAMEKAVVEFQGFLECLDDPTECGIISAVGVWHKQDIQGKAFLQEAFEMGSKI